MRGLGEIKVICLKEQTEHYLDKWRAMGLTIIRVEEHNGNTNIITVDRFVLDNKPNGTPDDSGVSCFGGVLSMSDLDAIPCGGNTPA